MWCWFIGKANDTRLSNRDHKSMKIAEDRSS